MRPKTIVYFEVITFGTLLFNTLRSYLDWDRILRPAPIESLLLRYYVPLTIIIGSFVLYGTLTLLVSRRRSKIAMWVSIALFSISVAFLVLEFVTDIIHTRLVPEHMIRALEHISHGVGYGLLFTPSARRWINREDEKDENGREAA